MQFKIRTCFDNLESTFSHVQDLYTFTNNGLERSSSRVSTSTTLTARIKLAGWLKQREGTWKLDSRSTSTTVRLQQRDFVFMSHSDFQLGDFLNTGHSKPQPSAGAPQHSDWDEIDKLLNMANDPLPAPYQPPVVPSQRSAGAPRDREVDELFNIANNAGRNLVTPGMNKAPRNYIPAMPSQPPAAPSQHSAGAPRDPGWDEVDDPLQYRE